MADTKTSPSLNPPADAEGKVSNRPDGSGTNQLEPTPEELPSDTKVAPIAEQQAPNSASRCVGAIEDPKLERDRKTLQPDMSSAVDLLPPGKLSDQKPQAERAEAAATVRSTEGR